MTSSIYERYKRYAKEYKMNISNMRKLWGIIKPICFHPEFLARCEKPFYHHDTKMLGDHIICDAIVTYIIVQKLKERNEKFKHLRVETAVVIAMFHDLYEIPWQNTFNKKRLRNKHGFVHPIEATVNAITWFPEYFTNKEKALIIIDGIMHHMYPLPVRAVDKSDIELNNQKKYDALPEKYKNMIKLSTDIGKIGHYSFRKSFFTEGKIMSKADKMVALKKDIGSINGYIALLSGKNKNIK